MLRRLTLLLAAGLTVGGLAGVPGTARADVPAGPTAPGAVQSAERLIRPGTTVSPTAWDGTFRVYGYPGDTSTGLLEVGFAGHYYPFTRQLPPPCPDPGTGCSADWTLELGGVLRHAPVDTYDVFLTMHDAQGYQHRFDLGDVRIQQRTPGYASVSAKATVAEMPGARRLARCGRVRTPAAGLGAGSIGLRSPACRGRGHGASRAGTTFRLTVPSGFPTTAELLDGVSGSLVLRRLNERGRVRVSARASGGGPTWRACEDISKAQHGLAQVDCWGLFSSALRASYGTVQVRIRAARGARVGVTSVGVLSRFGVWS